MNYSSHAAPSSDAILASYKNRAADKPVGALRIFFGFAAGVGKTYAMLKAGQEARSMGREVVAGYVEPHARPDTHDLLTGFEQIPALKLEYRGVQLPEFDLDRALLRKPDVILVDELAHTNAIGSRYEKRWQDIDELRRSGIDVWTTLNVQHIESLNDIVRQITGVEVTETVPDHLFDSADEVVLIDVTPEELLKRLDAGKVYATDQAQSALRSFFQRSNLVALRELSLRQTADRVHTDVQSARRDRASDSPWPTTELLLVCVGPSPTTSRVIRTAKRMANAMDADWIAVSVDITGAQAEGQIGRQISEHFRLAEELGAETITIAGDRTAPAIVDYARSKNVTKILIGKTKQPRWYRFLFGSVVDELLEQSRDIDVYVIQGDFDATASSVSATQRTTKTNWIGFGIGLITVVFAGLLSFVLRWFRLLDSEANTVMIFLAAVAFVAFRVGSRPAIVSCILSVLVFDFFFVPPRFTFVVADAQYAITFAVMLAIGMLISSLASRLKSQVEAAQIREQRTGSLYELGKRLGGLHGDVFLVSAVGKRMSEATHAEVAIFLLDAQGTLNVLFGRDSRMSTHAESTGVAHWVVQNNEIAGRGTQTLPNSLATFFPICGTDRCHGAIGIIADDANRLLLPEQRRFVEACCNQLALALERDQMAIEAADARIHSESEKVKNTLLNSVSHDLKTPLAAIAGATSTLLRSPSMKPETQQQLLNSISDEANRLNRLLENILQMSKLESGASNPNRQWHMIDEIIGSALHRTRNTLKDHRVQLALSEDLPMVFVDGVLLEQVFINLFENHARHTGVGSDLRITSMIHAETLRIIVSDDGPGLLPGSESKVFEKFYRGDARGDASRGSGLGLAICQAIMQMHAGKITAQNRIPSGAEFALTLPIHSQLPMANDRGAQ